MRFGVLKVCVFRHSFSGDIIKGNEPNRYKELLIGLFICLL